MSHEYFRTPVEDFSVLHFDHAESSIVGVGERRSPFIDMEPHVDVSMFKELHEEIKRGLPRCEVLKFARVEGELPPFFRDNYGGRQYESKSILEASDQDKEFMRGMNVQQRRKYAFMFLDAIMPWAFNVYLRTGAFLEKAKQDLSEPEWTQDAEHFPLLRKFIGKLPFESVGRVMFFCTYANQEVPPHRDFVVEKHKDHNINFFFDGPRKSYVFDTIANKKTYLQPTRAYFFNNRDYHGVEAEERFRYTLRVDGVFKKEIQECLGLKDGYVC